MRLPAIELDDCPCICILFWAVFLVDSRQRRPLAVALDVHDMFGHYGDSLELHSFTLHSILEMSIAFLTVAKSTSEISFKHHLYVAA